jgi:hypothetical protein
MGFGEGELEWFNMAVTGMEYCFKNLFEPNQCTYEDLNIQVSKQNGAKKASHQRL